MPYGCPLAVEQNIDLPHAKTQIHAWHVPSSMAEGTPESDLHCTRYSSDFLETPLNGLPQPCDCVLPQTTLRASRSPHTMNGTRKSLSKHESSCHDHGRPGAHTVGKSLQKCEKGQATAYIWQLPSTGCRCSRLAAMPAINANAPQASRKFCAPLPQARHFSQASSNDP